MRKLDIPMGRFSCLSPLFLHFNKTSVTLKISVLWPSAPGWSFLSFFLVMFSLHFPPASKHPSSIRRKWCCPGFSQGACVPSVHENYVGEWHRKLAGEPCDTLKSMVIFLIITLWFGNTCVQFYENSHLIFPRRQLSFWTFYDSLCKQSCSFR